MKNDNEIEIFKYKEVELVDNKGFIMKIKNSKKLNDYIELEKMRNIELHKIMKNENVYQYNESKFDYSKNIKSINENGKVENLTIMYGQIFIINYKKNTLNIIDRKIYEGHFDVMNKYNYCLNDIGIINKEIKVILNNISEIKKSNKQKNDCEFLCYILANRKSIFKQKDMQKENEIDNLLKLWNITEKYYPYKQYKIYLNLYKEVYLDHLKKFSNISLKQYENITEQMKKIKEEILKGV